MIDTGIRFLDAGLCVLPAVLTPRKQPALRTWKQYQSQLPSTQEVRNWFSDVTGICILTGTISGNLEMIDFDQRAEFYDRWRELVTHAAPALLNRLVVETSMSGGKHVIYRCEVQVPGNRKLAQRYHFVQDSDRVEIHGKSYKPRLVDGRWAVRVTLIETRGERGLFICAPSPGYQLEQGSFVELPVITADEREILIDTAMCLTEIMPAVATTPAATSTSGTGRPGDDFNERGDLPAVLQRHGWTLTRRGEIEYWARPGKENGCSATLHDGFFYVFSSNAAPFEPDRGYRPFTVYTMLEHEGDFSSAAGALAVDGYGRDTSNDGVDISRLVSNEPSNHEPESSPYPDPGPMPCELLRIPGFISNVMDYCMLTAPYPSQTLAFCGALALLAVLTGRKVRDSADIRTNLYLLALAYSSGGKDWPRKLNTHIMYRIGMVTALGEKFASGEGIQDSLFQTPAMLYQTDEIDSLLQTINKARDGRYESIISTLLTMYSSSNIIYPMRRKAGIEPSSVIDQPCLVVFGTAIPTHYYNALSERMLTNGFFARNIVVESGARSTGQEPSIIDPPASILDVAHWWAEFSPGGNLQHIHPQPAIVEADDEARCQLTQARLISDSEYSCAEGRSDPVGTTVWGRLAEQIRKLALLHAVSTNHQAPRITAASVRWATDFMMHQMRRMLFMAHNHVADNPFHADCLRIRNKLREAPSHQLDHSTLLRRMKLDAQAFQRIIATLEQQGYIEVITEPTPGRPHRAYRLRCE